MPMLERVQDYLKANGVPFLHSVHEAVYTARDLAAVEHLPLREVAKVVVFRSEYGFSMAVVPADRLLDLEQLRALMLSHVRLATEEELFKLFPNCELGAMPPLGNLVGMDVYLDEDLANESFIAFNAGTHRNVVELRFSDYRKLVDPIILPLTQPLSVVESE
jgi:Ala-tRNA(Pro) deacylase